MDDDQVEVIVAAFTPVAKAAAIEALEDALTGGISDEIQRMVHRELLPIRRALGGSQPDDADIAPRSGLVQEVADMHVRMGELEEMFEGAMTQITDAVREIQQAADDRRDQREDARNRRQVRRDIIIALIGVLVVIIQVWGPSPT